MTDHDYTYYKLTNEPKGSGELKMNIPATMEDTHIYRSQITTSIRFVQRILTKKKRFLQMHLFSVLKQKGVGKYAVAN